MTDMANVCALYNPESSSFGVCPHKSGIMKSEVYSTPEWTLSPVPVAILRSLRCFWILCISWSSSSHIISMPNTPTQKPGTKATKSKFAWRLDSIPV